jgi:hypothetical protein
MGHTADGRRFVLSRDSGRVWSANLHGTRSGADCGSDRNEYGVDGARDGPSEVANSPRSCGARPVLVAWVSQGSVGVTAYFTQGYFRRIPTGCGFLSGEVRVGDSHPSDKNKDVARIHPTDEDLSVGTPGWGTHFCAGAGG